MFNEFNKIYTFMAIVKERSFSKASKVLNISQPAVTLQIKKLEEAMGVALLIRKKNGVLLTKEGEKFYRLCKQFESTLENFKEEAMLIKDSKSKFSIATTPIIYEAIMPLLLEKISKTFNIDLDIKVQNEDTLLGCLKEKRCDICLVNDRAYWDNVIFKRYIDYDFVLVSNRNCEGKVYIKDLYKMNFIKDISKKYMNSLFQSQSLRFDDFKVAYNLDSALAIINTLLYNQNEQYFAFLPEFLVRPHMNSGKLYKIKVEELQIKRTLYIAALKENEDILNKFLTIKISNSN